MTILQQHPGSLIYRFSNRRFSQRSLTLTERYGEQSFGSGETEFIRKFIYILHRIDSRTQDEDERTTRIGISIRSLQIEGRRLSEILTKDITDKLLNRLCHLIRPEASQNQQFLKLTQFRVPISREQPRGR